MQPGLFESAGYAWNPMAIPPVLVGVGIALLGLLVLARERASAVSMAFCAMTGSGAAWLLSYAGVFCARAEALSLAWCRIENVGVAFIPLAVYLFILTVTRTLSRFRLTLFLSAVLSIGFAFSILFTNTFISGTYLFSWGRYARYGWFGWVFLGYFALLLGWGLRILYWSYRDAPSLTHARRLKAFLVAFSVAYAGSVDFLPALGVPIYPFGYLPAFLFLILAARAIWRYNLVDITLAFAASQILRTMSDALLVVDREGIIRLVNQSACHLFRKSEAELTGKPVWMLHGEFFSEERLRNFLRAQVVRDYSVSYKNESGETVFLEISASSLMDRQSEPAAVICILRDVTDRHHVEEALRRAQEEIRHPSNIQSEVA